MNDYMTIMEWFDGRGLGLAWELGVIDAVRVAMSIHEAVDKGVLVLSFKVFLSTWKILSSKIVDDEIPRSQLIVLNLLKTSWDSGIDKYIVL